ncbi:bifunctional glutamate N-acetyltransferase/amino-acid acetyltransferase ArgJ [Candidatus Omnitrophota bacterium]
MKTIQGGVTAPFGFTANGIASGIKKSGKKDLALIYSQTPAVAVGMFTTNIFKAAHIVFDKKQLKNGRAQAVIVNSGNANCVQGKDGLITAQKMARCTSQTLGINETDVLVASTGIIDQKLPVEKVERSVPLMVKNLSKLQGFAAAQAIMTTDTKPKQIAVTMKMGGSTVTIGAMAKGAGMIFPHLSFSGKKHATMLAFITTDAVIEHRALRKALKLAVDQSFNCITVDGQESTNDSVFVLANGLSGNRCIELNSKDFKLFCTAIDYVCLELAKMIIADAEGANKVIKITVKHAKTKEDAKRVANSVANSILLKAAVFGGNQNNGRIMAAMGSSGAQFNQSKVEIVPDSFRKKDIQITIDLKMGDYATTVYTSDLSVNYIRINAGYN